MFAERLRWAWEEHRASTSIDPVMRFTEKGLVLGAGAVLAASGGSTRDTSIDPCDMRLKALLAAAHWRSPDIAALFHLRRAAERWRNRQDAHSEANLAMSRLNRLERPEADSRCLFVADAMMKR